MAGMTIDYSVRLQVIKSSIDDLQKVLDKLEPNSAGFNRLNKVIKSMRREVESFQVQAAKGFDSQQDFNKAGRSLSKIEDSLIRVDDIMDGLKFSDIKLTPEQIKSFARITEEIRNASQAVDEAKKKFKEGLIADSATRSILTGIDPKLIEKDLDTIVGKVGEAAERAGIKVMEAQDKYGLLKGTQEKIGGLTQGGISVDTLGQNVFDRFFKETKNGLSFKATSKNSATGSIKADFLNYLKEEFKLTQEDIDGIVSSLPKNFTAKDLSERFLGMGREIEEARKQVDEARSRLEAIQNVKQQFEAGYLRDDTGQALGVLAKAEDEARKVIDEGTEALKRQQNALRDNVRRAEEKTTADASIKQASQSLRDELDKTNNTYLKIQQTQRNFNSIKMAITNFMGFTQVLNLTRNAIRNAMNHIKQLDATMNGISIVTKMTTADLWKQIDVYSDIAQKYGVSIQGVYDVSKIYYQAGYETNDVLTLMNETLKLSKVSGLDYAKATDYMMTATRGFHMEVSEAAKVVDVYSALAASTAVSQEELAVAMSKTASSLESVGATFEEASSMIATMEAVTRESSTNIGSALKSIASRLILLGA